MQIPLSFKDFTLWLALIAIILLVTTELLSPYYGRSYILIERGRLRLTALILSIAYMIITMLML